MNENQKLQERLLAELDSIEAETTDSKILEAINNIRNLINES